jgi:hypothetical protein
VNAVYSPLIDDFERVAEVEQEVVGGHGAAGEEVLAHPVVVACGLEVVGEGLVEEDVHEQQTSLLEPAVNVAHQLLIVLHVLEHLDAHDLREQNVRSKRSAWFRGSNSRFDDLQLTRSKRAPSGGLKLFMSQVIILRFFSPRSFALLSMNSFEIHNGISLQSVNALGRTRRAYPLIVGVRDRRDPRLWKSLRHPKRKRSPT